MAHDATALEAHCLMLWHIKALAFDDLSAILTALEEVKAKHRAGSFEMTEELQDVHMNIEAYVVEKAGSAGEMLHLARSRNDQVMTDTRLYLRREILKLADLLKELISAFLDLGSKHTRSVIPFYTHTRAAQPTTFSHLCLSYAQALMRDMERLGEAYGRVNVNPLGAGAGGGVGLPIDRRLTSGLLGFDEIQENTLDIVTSRGEVESEILSVLCLLFMHLSRISEDLILWSGDEFGMIKIEAGFLSGSSLMPQKRNPDFLELVRARTSEVYGWLVKSLVILKGLPSGYNRDTQETKGPVFLALDSARETVEVFTSLVRSLEINKTRMSELCRHSSVLATDLVELLVSEGGFTFREAYRLVKRAVEQLADERQTLDELTAERLGALSEKPIGLNSHTLRHALTPLGSISRRRHIGSPAPEMVEDSLSKSRKELARMAATVKDREQRLHEASILLQKIVASVLLGDKGEAAQILASISQF